MLRSATLTLADGNSSKKSFSQMVGFFMVVNPMVKSVKKKQIQTWKSVLNRIFWCEDFGCVTPRWYE